jgi:hypothetical protein
MRKIAFWILAVLVGAAMLLAGCAKTVIPATVPEMVEKFELYWPVWSKLLPFFSGATQFRKFVGGAEIAGGLAVLVAPMALKRLAALLIAFGPMACAVYTHLVLQDGLELPPAVIGSLALVLVVVGGDDGAADKDHKD